MAEPVRVLVVDDFRISRSFFEMYVRSSSRYALAGSLSLAEEALPFCERHPVDMVIMDVMMRAGTDGLTAAARLKERFPGVKIILCTSAAETSWEEKARQTGVESFWYKEYSTEPLLEVMDRTAAGERVYPTALPELRFGNTTRANLTDRELDVL
ncbi:MAG: response regulator transcription factor, partial [Clostridia bacterium]|nr:response regulator transcription factor [Clostridia bacterium]